MSTQQAIDLVRKTFESSFDKKNYVELTKNLLNHVEDAPFVRQGNFIPDQFKPYISRYERISKYTDGEHRVDILIVHLNRETSIERARSMQRNFVAGYLQGRYGTDPTKDAALVAFVSPNTEDWRFSLVKMEYQLEETDKGGMKVKEEYSPARRWSFLVGKHEKSHTAQSRLVPIIANDEHDPTLVELEEAFNIEKVTREFFEKYRDLFIRTKQELDIAVSDNPKTNADFASKGIDTVNLSKKLLGQIIFLYYLQKKGWFGVPRDANWGEGSKNFLRELFEKKHGEYDNFFNDVLEHLFYDALRNDRDFNDYYYGRFNCRIPFLNGGLFDPMNNYDWVHTDILLPNILFSNQNKTKEGDIGDGILDVFDRYNFTVKEDEPFEKEVAIDPELLGKAYEKFNAIRPDNYEAYLKALKSGKRGDESKFNKQYGVFYTPREIVHFMCQQSLINYLFTELEGTANKEDIEMLIFHGEQILENDARVVAEGRETKDYSFLMPESIRMNAVFVDQKLASIKMCDPAVGSGAFPVGMMSEIIKTRLVLETYNKTHKTPYDLKHECIENSLYGVDIDSGAVEIAKLRLWLSLVVDEDDPQNIKPLPNLDYKIVCGNSLIGFPENWGSPIEQEIILLIHQHLNETNPSKKEQLKAQIDERIQVRYRNSLRTFGYKVDFDYRTAFAEVYKEKGGFDVLIANPPYGAELTEKQKKYLKTRHEKIVERIRNTFLYFLGETYRQSKPNGTICLILPNELLFQIYMTKARRYFLENSRILFAVNLGEDVFEAIVPTCVIGIAKSMQSTYPIPVADLRGKSLKDLPLLLVTNNFSITTNQKILEAPNNIFSFDISKSDLINRLTSSFKPFEDFCEDVANGISTSCDDVYIVSEQTAKANNLEKDYLKECIRGGQLNRFYCPENTHEFVLYITNNFDPKKAKNIYQFLNKYKELLINKSIEKKQGKREWHILFRGRYEGLFIKPKIIFRQTGDRIVSAVDRIKGYYCINSVHIGLVKPQYYNKLDYLTGILNSKLLNFFYQEISQEKGRVLAEVKPQRIRSLPIAEANSQEQTAMEHLVGSIVAAKKANPQANTTGLEQEIDQLVYQLYELTDDEIKIVEGRS